MEFCSAFTEELKDDRYLYVDMQSAKKSEPWDFKAIILNTEKERRYSDEIPVEYYRKHNYYRPSKFEKMKFAAFDISSDYTYRRNHKGIPITVSFNGRKIETTLSGFSSNKRIEFRIPLEKVGLDGPNKEVEFMLKSACDSKADKKGEYPFDWVPNGKLIVVTTGLTYWQMSSMIFFIGVSFIVYRIRKKRKELI